MKKMFVFRSTRSVYYEQCYIHDESRAHYTYFLLTSYYIHTYHYLATIMAESSYRMRVEFCVPGYNNIIQIVCEVWFRCQRIILRSHSVLSSHCRPCGNRNDTCELINIIRVASDNTTCSMTSAPRLLVLSTKTGRRHVRIPIL